ncbi:hypothetical protein CEXT_19521 [Caerostris extrusa]|uniref:Uncharacterized protein n=1 Tax=Caerostris extrusa TaxID=172846 RepID=A0AAV4VQA5_CAEEX|nr:hypothetical protein CEXT_19521 [Caerostris extrusa]
MIKIRAQNFIKNAHCQSEVQINEVSQGQLAIISKGWQPSPREDPSAVLPPPPLVQSVGSGHQVKWIILLMKPFLTLFEVLVIRNNPVSLR